MERAERIAFAVMVLGLFVFIILELRKNGAAIVTVPGSPEPEETKTVDAANTDVGLWRIYYNTPGTYNFTPAIIPTVMPPALVAPSQPNNANPQLTSTGDCYQC